MRRGKSIEVIIQKECGKRKVSEEEVRKGSRRDRVSEVRAVIALRSKEELGISGTEIARYVGVNTSSINRAPTRMDHLPLRNKLCTVRINPRITFSN